MSKIEVDAIEPQSGTSLTIGASGDTVTVPSGVTFDASNATTTLPSNVVTTTGTQTLTNKTIDASQLTDSTISLAKLSATGTKDATTFLRGDNTFAEVPAGGITETDMWRFTADISNTSADPIQSNLERVDNASFAKIGTGMSVSSGVWTFPSTGLYRIDAFCSINTGSTTVGIEIEYSGDSGSTWDELSKSNSTGNANTAYCTAFVNITNTSTQKLKFVAAGAAATDFFGNTSFSRNGFIFIRLGDSQ